MRILPRWFFLVTLLCGTEAAFTFVLQINGHSTSGSCDTFINSGCETYFALFCLRGARAGTSTDTSDCPLGAYRQRFNRQSGSIRISSSVEWEGNFQLFIQAFDDDGGFSNSDHLDNIFVEGSLRNDAFSSAMSFTGGRVTVRVQFQRTCDDNYYGVNCFTYCVPADNDAAGHFTCNENDGSKVCLPGYSNPVNSCRENIDDCASDPCQNGGNCTDLVSDFACTCLPGYTDKNCSMDIDECEDTYCPGNSTCIDSIDAFTCACNPGYTGENCSEVLDPCESGPCSNNATCVMLDSFYSMCACLPGYSGPYCEVNIDECLTANCLPGTTCQDGINSFQCLQQTVENKTGSIFSSAVIGYLVAVAFIVIVGCAILWVLLLCFGIRQKSKKLKRKSFNRNNYVTSLTQSLEYNSLYRITDSSTLSGKQSPAGSIQVCENSLYVTADEQTFQDKVSKKETFEDKNQIYEEPTSVQTITTSPNMSYETLNLASPCKQLKNPLYGQGLGTPTQGAVMPPPIFSLPPPVYNVPRPASDMNDKSFCHSSFDHTSPEHYYASIDGTPSQEKISLSPVSPGHTASIPSSQHS